MRTHEISFYGMGTFSAKLRKGRMGRPRLLPHRYKHHANINTLTHMSRLKTHASGLPHASSSIARPLASHHHQPHLSHYSLLNHHHQHHPHQRSLGRNKQAGSSNGYDAMGTSYSPGGNVQGVTSSSNGWVQAGMCQPRQLLSL